MLYKLATTDRIVLYKKDFSLGKGLPFQGYLKLLNDENFSPFILYIENLPLFSYSKLEFEFSYPLFFPFYGLIKPFTNWIFLNQSVLRYSENEREITLEASISIGWFFLILLIGVLFAGVMLHIILETGFRFFLLPSLLMLLYIILLVAIFKRDIKRCDKIIFLGLKPKE